MTLLSWLKASDSRPRGLAFSTLLLRLTFALALLAAFGCEPAGRPAQPTLPVSQEGGEQDENAGLGLVIEPERLDFGEVHAGETNEQTVRLSNKGSGACRIQSIESSCSCTEADIDSRDIPPGGDAVLTVRLLLDAYPMEEVHTRVILTAEEPSEQPPEIEVNARVIPEYTIQPLEIDFGKVRRATRAVRAVVIEENGVRPVSLLSVEVPQGVSYTIAGPIEPLATGHSGHPLHRHYEVEFTFAPGPTTERLEGQAIVVTDVPRLPRQSIRMRGQVTGIDYTLAPSVLVFGPSAAGSETGNMVITFANPTEVLSLIMDDEYLEPTIVPSNAGNQYTLRMRIAANAPQGNRSGRLRASLREGDLTETLEIPYFGTITP